MKQSEQTGVISVEQPETIAFSASRGEDVWAWLGAMARSLGLVAEILDARDVPGPSVSFGPAAASLKTALADPESPVRAAVKAAREGAHGVSETETPQRTICYRLSSHGLQSEVLVLAHDRTRISPGHSLAPKGLTDEGTLERIGPWLARAVEAQLATKASADVPRMTDLQFDRLASLRKLLQDAADRGDESDVITAFGEALLAWDGIEVRGYVEDLQGRFAQVFAAPGAARGHVNIALEPGAGLRSTTLAPLSLQELDHLGLPRGRRTLAVQLDTALLEPWIVVCAETFRALDEAHLSASLSLLQESLERASVTTETRTTWAVLQPLLNAGGQVDAALDSAMQELARVMNAASAVLTLVSPGGTTLMSVGEPDSAAAVRPFGRLHFLVSTLPVRDLYTLSITVRRAPGQSFTHRELHLVERAAGLIAAWLPSTIAPSARMPERRAEARQFELILERAAAQALKDGLSAAVVVMTLPADAPRGDTLQRWLADIRGQLRGSDLAGMLSEREIGVLLSGTPTAEVPMVSARLERCLTTVDRGPLKVAVGTATRAAGHDSEEPIVRQARLSARRGSSGLVEARHRPGSR